jgi:hypothetical protein
VDEGAQQLVRQQETVIHVLRERVMELEIDLINARCATLFNSQAHTHDGQHPDGEVVAEDPPASGAVSSVP